MCQMLLFLGSVYFDVQQYGRYNRFVPGTQQQEDKETKAGGESRTHGYRTFFMLISSENENYHAYKC